jgi:FkbM family methyltransferase
MYEPNPLCVGILQTNTAISLPKNSYEINKFGLGRANETLGLRVPRNNWGGAYINCDQNSYESETLLRKDAFVEDREDNYLIIDVEIKNAEQTLKALFFKLCQEGRLNGAIKIDVEGMELEILYAIANVLSSDMEVSIIFENWSKEFPSGELLRRFGNRASLYILRQHPTGGRKSLAYKFLKLMKLISYQHLTYTLDSCDMNNTHNMQGDLVLEISKN